MKMIKFNKRYCGMAAVAFATIGLASCTNELNEADLGNNGNVTVNGISLAKLPEIKAWSGSNILGDGSVNSGVTYSTRSGDPTVERYQSNYGWLNVPSLITEAENRYVLNYLAEHPNQGYDTFDCDTYYIQVLGGSFEEYTTNPDQNGVTQKVKGSEKMNYCVINGIFTYYNNNTMNSEDIIKISNVPAKNASYTDSFDGNSTRNNYKFYFITLPNEAKYGDLAGKTQAYLCFDYMTLSQNGTIDPDGKYDDWVIKLTPADGSAVLDPSTNIQDPDEEDEVIAVKTTSEVEVNLAINDYDPTASREEGIADIVTKLSIHVRAATDVKVVIPIQSKYLCDADDLIILEKHLEELTGHGGATTENVVNYSVGGNNVELHSEINFETGKITVWTVGINEAVIEYCIENNGDGINFEIWNYFNNSAFDDFSNAKAELKEYLDNATIEFKDSYPDYYINAYNKKESGDVFEWDCSVSIVDDQKSQFGAAKVDLHLNGSEYNQIYKNKDFEGEDGAHDHDFLWYLETSTEPEE